MSRRSVVTALVVATVSIMTIAGLVVAVFAASDGPSLTLGGRIALVEVNGVIADDRALLDDIRRLRRDGSVRGWVVSINSPGGVVAPSQSIYQALSEIRSEGQPVVASIGGVGASGGYYVALAADTILALPGSVTGSIGVVMQYPNVEELMDRVGVRMEIVQAGEQKDLGSPFRTMGPEDRAILEAMLDDVHDQFIEAVAEARGMELAAVRELADGRVLSGRMAMEAGLVDRMGNVEDALDLAGRMAGLGPDPRIAYPPRDEPGWLIDMLLGEAAGRAIQQVAARAAEATMPGPLVKYLLQ